jgi:hypothetical protein
VHMASLKGCLLVRQGARSSEGGRRDPPHRPSTGGRREQTHQRNTSRGKGEVLHLQGKEREGPQVARRRRARAPRSIEPDRRAGSSPAAAAASSFLWVGYVAGLTRQASPLLPWSSPPRSLPTGSASAPPVSLTAGARSSPGGWIGLE